MIRINLLPEEFRTVQKVTKEIPYLRVAAISGVLFAVITVFLYFDFLAAQAKLSKLKKEWAVIQPRSIELRQLENEVNAVLKPEKDFLEQYLVIDQPLTSFLTWISEYLPETSWLLEVRLDRKKDSNELFIKGIAFSSKEKSSIQYIEEYLHKLKEKIPNSGLSLTTTRQKSENKELTQFIASLKWGGAEPQPAKTP